MLWLFSPEWYVWLLFVDPSEGLTQLSLLQAGAHPSLRISYRHAAQTSRRNGMPLLILQAPDSGPEMLAFRLS